MRHVSAHRRTRSTLRRSARVPFCDGIVQHASARQISITNRWRSYRRHPQILTHHTRSFPLRPKCCYLVYKQFCLRVRIPNRSANSRDLIIGYRILPFLGPLGIVLGSLTINFLLWVWDIFTGALRHAYRSVVLLCPIYHIGVSCSIQTARRWGFWCSKWRLVVYPSPRIV